MTLPSLENDEAAVTWGGGATPPAAAASAMLLVLQVVLLLAMAGSVATRTWQDRPWLGVVLVLAAAAAWAPELRRRRARRWWFFYVGGIFAYTLLRSIADDTFIPIQTRYVIDIDQGLFLGTHPVVWLQDRFFDPGHVSLLDLLAVQIHWSFFLAPHIAAVLIFVTRRELFPRYAAVVVGTMYAGLVLFFLLPTTPPWLAGQTGDLHNVFRVMDFVGGKVDSGTYQSFYASLGEPNSVAAMPSIHMGVTFAMYLWAREHAPKFAAPLLVYSLLMGAALVYLAEHYVLDLAAGVAVAWLCNLAARRLVPIRAPHPVVAADEQPALAYAARR